MINYNNLMVKILHILVAVVIMVGLIANTIWPQYKPLYNGKIGYEFKRINFIYC